jgi:DNA-binding LacI/PurR family transcriptional regulator
MPIIGPEAYSAQDEPARNQLPNSSARPIIDNVGGAIAAVNHLLQHGRTSIADIGGSEPSIPARLRKQGYEEALKCAGVEPNPLHVSYSGWRFEDACKTALNLMQQPDRPNAILAASDLIAIGALSAVREMGLKVPDDVSIIGFDDIDMSQEVRPSLTTIRIDKSALGKTAFDLLFQRISGQRDLPLRVTVPTTLIVRETVGKTPE